MYETRETDKRFFSEAFAVSPPAKSKLPNAYW